MDEDDELPEPPVNPKPSRFPDHLLSWLSGATDESRTPGSAKGKRGKAGANASAKSDLTHGQAPLMPSAQPDWREGLKIELQSWSDLCGALESRLSADQLPESPWLRETIESVRAVLDNLRAGGPGIAAHSSAASGQARGSMPEVASLQHSRNAMLHFATFATFAMLGRSQMPIYEAGIAIEIARKLAYMAGENPIVLRPSPSRPASAKPGPWQFNPAAKIFFESGLRPILEALDKACGLDDPGKGSYCSLAPAIYTGADPESVRRWSCAWTAATAALTTLILLTRGGGTIPRAIKAIIGKGSILLPITMNAIGSPLPQKLNEKLAEKTGTKNNLAFVEFWASPMLCQILEAEDTRHWQAAADKKPSSVTVSLNAPDGMFHGNTLGHDTYYRGRTATQLYLTVWLEQMATMVVTEMKSTADDRQQPVLPDKLIDEVNPGQYRTVAELLDVYNGLVSLEQGPMDYYAPPSEGLVLKKRRLSEGIMVVRPQQAWVEPAIDPKSLCLGGVRLPWAIIDSENALWTDLALIVHTQGVWQALTVEIDEFDEDEGLMWISIDASEAAAISIDALRVGIRSAWWASRSENLGLILTGAVDLESPAY